MTAEPTPPSKEAGEPPASKPEPTPSEGEGKPKKEKGKKAPPANLVIPPKKPKLSKAERRALQEQQRAAKEAAKTGKPGDSQGDGKKDLEKADVNADSGGKQQSQQLQQNKPQKKQSQKSAGESTGSSADSGQDVGNEEEKTMKDDKTVDLFSHLPQFHDLPDVAAPEHAKLHPAVLELGLQYAKGSIRGGNSRCRAMLHAFLRVFEDYRPPAGVSDFRSHLHGHVLKPSFTFWTIHCRPHSVSMGNAFTLVKMAVTSLERDIDYILEARPLLIETLEQFLRERIEFADRAIAQHALGKIRPVGRNSNNSQSVVITYGYSEAIAVVLETAHAACEGDNSLFVYVVDARPLWEGRKLLHRLRASGIPCGYLSLPALTNVLPQVAKRNTKVLLGASALRSNGSILGRVGTATVALLANDHHVPVLVCCESYKISNRVQVESITSNELGDPNALELSNWKEVPNLKLLNLLYDVTPSEFVSGIVTEVGIIPPTSVAVLLREMNPQDSAAAAGNA